MTRHATHDVHRNSVLSFASLDRDTRDALVLNAYLLAGVPLTDRQVLEWVGLDEPNAVRPRITELVADGMLVETGSAKCHVTGKKVRLCQPTAKARG